jgi:hypothetical protein
MPLRVTKIDVWSGEISDRPGGLAEILESIAAAGANLEMVVARRQADKPGTGIVFLAPLRARKAQAAAMAAGLRADEGVAALRVEGADRAGTGARLVRAIAAEGINLRGVSAAALGGRFVLYFAFDGAADASRAARAIRGAELRPAKRKAKTKK